MNQPVLYLIPTPLGAADTPCLLAHEQAAIVGLTDFVVEAEKTARAHLKALGVSSPIRDLNLRTLNEHTDPNTIAALLAPLQAGRSMGLLSEAGCPAVADPGAQLVALAHAHGFAVMPLVGPSSILLALMASGANGQCFAFKGYLPTDKAERSGCLKALETRSRSENETQLFIETPYRNAALLQALLQTLHPNTRLSVSSGLTLATSTTRSQSVQQWRDKPGGPDKHTPAVFAMGA